MTTTEQLAAMLRERHDRGLAKYGTTVDRTDLTTEEWAQHAIEEMLDGAAYLMRLKATLPEAIRRLEADNRELRDRLAVALRQRDEAIARAPSVPEPGSTAAHHVEILRARVKELEAELAEAKASLAKAPSASEAPGEGGDSDRRRLEALERYLEGDTFREVWKTSMGPFAAGTKIEGQHFDAPTLAALADKLAENRQQPATHPGFPNP